MRDEYANKKRHVTLKGRSGIIYELIIMGFHNTNVHPKRHVCASKSGVIKAGLIFETPCR